MSVICNKIKINLYASKKCQKKTTKCQEISTKCQKKMSGVIDELPDRAKQVIVKLIIMKWSILDSVLKMTMTE